MALNDQQREYQRQWRLANREKILAYREKNRERIRDTHRKWVSENYGKVLAKNQRWGAANREKERERHRQYDRDNREAQNERKSKWRHANPEKTRRSRLRQYAAHYEKERAANRRWKDENPHKVRVYNHRRRGRVIAVQTTFTAEDWKTLCARSPHCHWCKEPFGRVRRPTHDHVVPLSLGGANTLDNSVCACGSCNCRKGARQLNPITGQGILL